MQRNQSIIVGQKLKFYKMTKGGHFARSEITDLRKKIKLLLSFFCEYFFLLSRISDSQLVLAMAMFQTKMFKLIHSIQASLTQYLN